MMEEKNSAMERKAPVGGMPKFDVWAYGVAGEYDLRAAKESGEIQKMELMRKVRGQDNSTLIGRVTAKLRVTDVHERRRKDAKKMMDSTHRELEVHVEVVEDVPMGVTNGLDDGQGLSAFKAGTQFVLVYCPAFVLVYCPADKLHMARVSRSSAVLYAEPAAEEAEEAPEDGEA